MALPNRLELAVPTIALPDTWTSKTLSSIRKALLTWFDREQRQLPWRMNRDPYRIWVSEVMLQQTTVPAVCSYFDRFLAKFPTMESLAAASEQEVLRMWAGLGFYRRARHLHQAARLLVAQHGGELPRDPTVWASLPGVGRYILGAVLSQAFDQRLPIVEANSQRVISRLFGSRLNPRDSAGKKWVWLAAEQLLPRHRVGDFNQSLMELGALVCTPTAPRCGSCPLAQACEANRQGLQQEIPLRSSAKKMTELREVAVIIQSRGKFLLCQLPAHAKRWANMWEVPHAETREGESETDAARRIAKDLTGLDVSLGQQLTTIRHVVTRWSINLQVLETHRITGRFRAGFYAQGHWIKPTTLPDYPISSPQRRLIQAFVEKQNQGV